MVDYMGVQTCRQGWFEGAILASKLILYTVYLYILSALLFESSPLASKLLRITNVLVAANEFIHTGPVWNVYSKQFMPLRRKDVYKYMHK